MCCKDVHFHVGQCVTLTSYTATPLSFQTYEVPVFQAAQQFTLVLTSTFIDYVQKVEFNVSINFTLKPPTQQQLLLSIQTKSQLNC